MRTKNAVLGMAAVLGLAVATAPARAQDQARRVMQEHQMMQLQEQTARMNEAMQRMSRIQDRAHVMEQQMLQMTTRAWEHEGMMDAMHVRSQEQLQTMAHAMSESARNMHQAMEQFRDMMGAEGSAAQDPAAVRDFERLRAHWEDMAGRMEEGLTLMERLRDRLQLHDPS